MLEGLPFLMKSGKEMGEYTVKRSASRQVTQHNTLLGAQGSIQAHIEMIFQQDFLV